MHPRAEELIRSLRLQPHPEGGHYREVFRSPRQVRPLGAPAAETAAAPERSALTTIHFLLGAGEVSRWHRLDADEAWHYAEGEPVEMFLLDASARILTRLRLGPLAPGAAPVHVVPAGSWVAARPSGAYALVGCTMGPGFEFAGFTLLRDVPDVAAQVRAGFPELGALL